MGLGQECGRGKGGGGSRGRGVAKREGPAPATTEAAANVCFFSLGSPCYPTLGRNPPPPLLTSPLMCTHMHTRTQTYASLPFFPAPLSATSGIIRGSFVGDYRFYLRPASHTNILFATPSSSHPPLPPPPLFTLTAAKNKTKTHFSLGKFRQVNRSTVKLCKDSISLEITPPKNK